MNCIYCNNECEAGPTNDLQAFIYNECKPCSVTYCEQNGRKEIQFPRWINSRSFTLTVLEDGFCELSTWDFIGFPDDDPDKTPLFNLKKTLIMPQGFAKNLTPQNALNKIRTYLTFL